MKWPIVDVDAWRATLDPRVMKDWEAYFTLRNREAAAAERRARRAHERGGLPPGKRYLSAAEMHAQAKRF